MQKPRRRYSPDFVWQIWKTSIREVCIYRNFTVLQELLVRHVVNAKQCGKYRGLQANPVNIVSIEYRDDCSILYKLYIYYIIRHKYLH